MKDILSFWRGLLAGQLISRELVAKMFSKQSGDGTDSEEGYYGYGVWIIDNPSGKDFVYFQGCDPGVSFISEYNPNNGIMSVLVGNLYLINGNMAKQKDAGLFTDRKQEEQ